MDSTTTTWRNGMSFDVEVEGHTLPIDAAEAFGGQGYGPKPKTLLLTALAGCTGMDVVSMLKKMRMEFDAFAIKVDGQLTETHPKTYETIHLTYTFSGDGLDSKKIEKAVRLSQEQYCGVTAILEKTAKITYDIVTQ